MSEVHDASRPAVFKSAERRRRYLVAYEEALKTWPVPFEEFDVPTSFGDTHVVACGPKDAPPLVLLHGNFASSTMWRHNARPLSQSHRILAFDTIDDLGKSVPSRLPRSRADYVVWLAEAIRSATLPCGGPSGPAEPRVSLVGMSYGGFLALNLALARPGMVDKLVLLAPGVRLALPTLRYFWGMPMILLGSPFTVRLFFGRASVKGYPADDPELAQLTTGIPALRSRMPLWPDITDQELRGLAVPTLLLVGEKEMLYDARSATRHAAEVCPGLRAEIIPGAGHCVSTDQPDLVNAEILAFLEAAV